MFIYMALFEMLREIVAHFHVAEKITDIFITCTTSNKK